MSEYDVIVLGGGAAGLMCAITAGGRGRRVIVLEGSNRIGKKILMSGGGRCNFTNLHCEPANFISANPGFCISALSRYTQQDFIALVEQHSIAYHEKEHGQLFCDHSSKDIVAMLETECREAGVQIRTRYEVESVVRENDFRVAGSGENFDARSLVIATGGLSIPKMGATDFGYRLARQFGVNVHETRAGLVPFTFTGVLHELTGRLTGVSVLATLSTGGQSFTGDILFTHRGLSGPAALQLSSYWTPGEHVVIDLLPATGFDVLDAKANFPKSMLRTVLSEILPRALVLEMQGMLWPGKSESTMSEIANDELRNIVARLRNWSIKPAATEGYRTAEVTMGGVDTDELSSKTMESRRVPGLYFIGEVVDVTGHLGGFNFQWAWSSAWAAGQVV